METLSLEAAVVVKLATTGTDPLPSGKVVFQTFVKVPVIVFVPYLPGCDPTTILLVVSWRG